MGAEIFKGRRRPGPSKVKAVLEYGGFEKKKHVQRYLCLVGTFRPHIARFSALAQPLYDVAKGRGPLKMTEEAHNARHKIDAAVTRAAANMIPDPKKPFTVRLDASDIGLGAVLEQDGVPVHYWSQQLSKAERNYSAVNRELLCIVKALEAMELHVGGCRTPVTVLSDHQKHEGTEATGDGKHKKRFDGLRSRWHDRLRRFNFKVVWVPREQQEVPDALAKSPQFEALKALKDGREESDSPSGEEQSDRQEVPSPIPPVPPLQSSALDRPVVAQMTAVVAQHDEPKVWRERQLRDVRLRALIEFKEEGTLPVEVSEAHKVGIVKHAQHHELVECSTTAGRMRRGRR